MLRFADSNCRRQERCIVIITIRRGSGTPFEMKVGTTHHPYTGPLPKVGQSIVIPADASVDPLAQGKAKVTRIVWHYGPESAALWPEIVCRIPRRRRRQAAV
jgi:hypothetical protein